MLIRMYREFHYELGGAIVWTRSAASTERVAHIVPDGCIDIIWAGGSLMVAGPDTYARVVATPAGVDYLAVRFAPGQAPAMLGTPAHELRDAQVPLDAVWPSTEARRLASILAETPLDRPTAFATYLRARLVCVKSDPVVREIARRLGRADTVDSVATAVHLSPRQLYRRCLEAFGYGPKTLAKVLRFNQAMSLAYDRVQLADVAAQAGYADQAHLARDVRALTGTTLTRLLAPTP